MPSGLSYYRIFGQNVKVLGEIVGAGNVRGREINGSGGGNAYFRHFYAGGSAGGYHIQSVTLGGANTFSIMPDGEPPSNIQALVNGDGTVGWSINCTTGETTVTSLITDIDAAITFGDGRPNSGVGLASNAEARSTANMDFTILAWQLTTDVGPSLRVQVLKQTYSSYDNSTWTDMSGTSTSTGGMPRIALGGGIKNTATNLSLWNSTTVSRGDIIRAVVTNNSGGNGWYSLALLGRRNVKKT